MLLKFLSKYVPVAAEGVGIERKLKRIGWTRRPKEII
jgi:hypothetical protein